jgi:hypothetical protein
VDTTLDRVAVDDVAAGLPVREFRWYRGRRHYSGWYWSATLQRLVAYESRLELARILLADFDEDVVCVAAQPFQLIGPDSGRIRRHVPDLLLVHRGGAVTVVDVKAPAKVEDPAVQAVFVWTRDLVGLRGWGFEAWSGADRQLLDNVRLLAGYRRTTVIDRDLIPAVLGVAAGPVSIGGIEWALRSQHLPVLVRPVVLHLLWTGVLRADLTRPLSLETEVRPGRQVTR